MLRQLIVNADDFGYTPGVSQGIIRANREGIVTSTSVMVNMPYAAEWVPRAQRDAPKLGLGLHLTLTAGRPVLPPEEVPDLVTESGTFLPKAQLIARLPRLDMAQVERELRAQIEAFKVLTGQPPDHLDSHHHITYLTPPLAALMIQLGRDLSVPIRRPVPSGPGGQEQAVHFLKDVVGDLPDAYIEEMIDILNNHAAKSGVPMPDQFVGVTELMCHPAEIDDVLRATSGYTDRRADELAALTHPSAREVVNSEFIQLITFGDKKR